MKRITKHFASRFAAALVLILAGCNSVQSIEAPHAQMTVREARKALAESLAVLQYTTAASKSLQEVRFTRRKVSFAGTVVLYAPGDTLLPAEPYHGSVTFAEMNNLSVTTNSAWSLVRSNGQDISLGATKTIGWHAYFPSERAAMMFIDAVYALKAAALAPDTEEADFAAFTASAQTWLAMLPKPEMSEEARTYRLLAKDAYRRKDFAAALDAYIDALEKFPMWPEGHYNAALLAAESGDYETAAHHMRRYLVLAPQAKDARASKDKLLLWQHKAKE